MPKIKVKDKNVLQRIKVKKTGKHAATSNTWACLCKSKQVGDVYHYHASDGDGDDCNDIIIMMMLVTMTVNGNCRCEHREPRGLSSAQKVRSTNHPPNEEP